MDNKLQSRVGQVLLAIGYALLGLFFIIWPGTSVQAICWIVGIGALIYGAVCFINYIRMRRRDQISFTSELFFGVTFTALGAFCLITPSTVVSILPFLLGLVLLLDAVGKFQRALQMRSVGFPYWWVSLVFAVCVLLLAVTLLFNPFGAVKFTMIFFGACLLADGLADLIYLFSTRAQ